MEKAIILVKKSENKYMKDKNIVKFETIDQGNT